MTPGRPGRGRRNGLAAAGARPGAARALPTRPRTAVAALAVLLLAGVLAVVASPAAAQSAPATPSAVTVTRADGTVTASWPAVANADSYHITYSTTGGASWQLAALNHPSASITISGADNTKTYIVAARARNAAGDSGWRNSPPAGPWQSPSQPVPPSTPSSVAITRDDGTVTASWPAIIGADSYHVTYSTTGGASWQLAALNHPNADITVSGADNTKTYIVGVRARNAAGDSGWRNSPATGPYTPPPPPPPPQPTEPPARPTGLSATAGNGSVTLAWSDPSDADITGYEYQVRAAPPAPGWGPWTTVAGSDAATVSVTVDSLANGTEYRFKVRAVNVAGASKPAPASAPWYAAATPDVPATPSLPPVLDAHSTASTAGTLTLGNYDGEWHYQSTTTAGAAGANGAYGASGQNGCVGPVGGTQATISGLDPNSQYAYSAFSDPQCSQQVGAASGMVTPAGNAGASLTADSITRTTATLTRWGFTQNWYYRANHGPHSSCSATAVTGPSTHLAGLSRATHYLYTAYADAQCSTPLAAGEFTTLPRYDFGVLLTPSIGTLTHQGVTLTPRHWATNSWIGDWYYRASTGPHSGHGACLGPVLRGGPLRLAGLRASTAYTYTMYDDPPRPSLGIEGCEVDLAEMTFTTAALPTGVTLAATTLRNDQATLAPDGWDQPWYWRKHQDGSPVGGCGGPVGPGAHTISTALLPDTAYAVKMYPYAGCSASEELAEIAFTVPELASAPSENAARLTLRHWPRQWWYLSHGIYTPQGDLAYVGGECRGPVAAGGTATATGLYSGYTYGFQAYSSAAACQNDRDDASRRLTAGTLGPMAQVTPVTGASLSASDVTGTTATLTIDGYSGYWYARQTAPTAGPCSAAVTGATLALTSLVEGQDHTYKAYNDADCANAITGASATFTTMSLTASSAVGTGATLAIGQHSGSWYYMADKAPHDTCQGPISTAAATLTGLTVGVSYSYTAYRDSGCAAAGTLATADFTIPTLAATDVTGTGATLTIAGHTGNWYYKANAAPHNTCQGPISANPAVLAGLSPSTSYTYAAYSNSGCSALVATASDFTTPVSLTATEIALTSATLAIDGHTAQWWYKADTGPDSTCQGPVAASTSTEALTGLEAATSYVYSAYSATGCNSTDLLATASAFSTGGLSVGNDTQSSSAQRPVGYYASQNIGKQFAWATSFTTPATGSFTLDSVLVKLEPGSTTYNLHAYIYTDNNGKPGNSLAHERKDLGGAKPTNDHVWRCSGSNCTLAAGATYWLVLRHKQIFSSIADIIYKWEFTSSASEVNSPSGAGWAIGDTSYRGEQTSGTSDAVTSAITWETNATSGATMFKLYVALPRSLDASDISRSAATLTLSGYGGVWWHKRTSPSGSSTCRRVEAGDAARLSGLSASTSYTYKAYDKAGCASADEIADETFSTTTASAPSLAASSITDTTATLRVSNHTAAWHYQAGTGPDAACGGPVAANTATKALAGLTAGTAYTYRAFSDSGCSAQLAAATFTTPKLTVGNITNTTATLTLVGGPDSWHYKHTTPTGGACSSAVTNGSATVTGLAAGASYTFAAYSDSGCSSLLTSAAAFAADAVVAADIGAASATLSLAGHSGSWYAKRTAPTDGACSGAIAAGGTHTASGLSPATAYTFTAYSDSGCSTAVGTGSFTTTPVTLAASGITTGGATLRLDGHTTAWSYRRSGAGCTSVNAGTATATLSGLTPGTAYRYSAYSGSTCGALLARAPAFTTLAVSVRNIADTSATLRLANYDGPWFYKATSGPHTACAGPVMGANTLVAGLSAGGTYTYSAYSDAACTNAGLLGTAPAFTTTELTAGSITASGATLTLAGHTGAWWFRNDVPYDPSGGTPYTQCYRSTSTTRTLSGLTAGHTYTFKAYSEQNCPPAKTIATATFTTSSS